MTVYYGGLDNLFLWILAAPALVAMVCWILYEAGKRVAKCFPEVKR